MISNSRKLILSFTVAAVAATGLPTRSIYAQSIPVDQEPGFAQEKPTDLEVKKIKFDPISLKVSDVHLFLKNQTVEDGCMTDYYRKGKTKNYKTSLGVGLIGAIINPGFLLTLSSYALIGGGSVGLTSQIIRDKNPKLSDDIDRYANFLAAVKRPTVLFPTAKPYYELGETLQAAYTMAGEEDHRLQKYTLIETEIENQQDEIARCLLPAKKQGMSREKIKLFEDHIDFLEASVAANSSSAESAAIQTAIQCAKATKVHLPEVTNAEPTLYTLLKLAAQNSEDRRDLRVISRSFAKTYLRVAQKMSKIPTIAEVAEAEIALDQKGIFCQNAKRPLLRPDFSSAVADQLKTSVK